ncbi:AraC-like DNA-binding protein [Chitinophaga skermanii]|uniref:AraC-like DNA-binding protein n=1 Tax=Chitinophaga skermanii TaxID=331697 RepID=A0A327QX81_9BACT|nr:helix-turn-helix domain-containing protein [Chitinophaga skermanii]RAJ08232.1 AraC-like DNA-binding protein [Chitinophaga skermanii]
MAYSNYFESNYKKFGCFEIDEDTLEEIRAGKYDDYIKIIFMPAGSSVTIDFDEYKIDSAALFCVGNFQYLHFNKQGKGPAYFIYYNRDFYCIQIHDAEVACDGILFNNMYNLPITKLPGAEAKVIDALYGYIKQELSGKESSHEEMIRTYLKQLIIRATRIWKQQQLGALLDEPLKETEFFRDFSRLVEIHFRTKHMVADYADLMGVAPKTLSAKFNRYDLLAPNDIIKDRIILEAKRLLCYSNYSVKEIAYQLGYDDPAYFNRLFTNKAGDSPATFKKKYLSGKKVQL